MYVVAVVSIVSTHGLSIDAHRGTQPNRCKLALYKPSIHFNSSLKQLYTTNNIGERFSYISGFGVTCIEWFKIISVELTWASSF